MEKNEAILKKYDSEDMEAELEASHSTSFQRNIESLYELIKSELNDKLIFEAVKECVLDKSCLLKLSEIKKTPLFDEAVWSLISNVAKSDYADAAKCILVGASTPAAMISLRAAEEAVREYYKEKTDTDSEEKTWGTIINELKRLDDCNKELLEYLDYIRKTKRNLAQHPDKVYDQREAERIFMEVISMVHDIYDDM